MISADQFMNLAADSKERNLTEEEQQQCAEFIEGWLEIFKPVVAAVVEAMTQWAEHMAKAISDWLDSLPPETREWLRKEADRSELHTKDIPIPSTGGTLGRIMPDGSREYSFLQGAIGVQTFVAPPLGAPQIDQAIVQQLDSMAQRQARRDR